MGRHGQDLLAQEDVLGGKNGSIFACTVSTRNCSMPLQDDKYWRPLNSDPPLVDGVSSAYSAIADDASRGEEDRRKRPRAVPQHACMRVSVHVCVCVYSHTCARMCIYVYLSHIYPEVFM